MAAQKPKTKPVASCSDIAPRSVLCTQQTYRLRCFTSPTVNYRMGLVKDDVQVEKRQLKACINQPLNCAVYGILETLVW